MIQLATGFEVLTSLPLDSRNLLSKAEMLAANDNVFPDYFLAQCSDDDGKLYVYKKSATPNAVTGKFTALDESFSPNIQVESLPVAGSDEEGKIYQYIGATDTSYTNGYWYICKATIDDTGTSYAWVRLDVQPVIEMEVLPDDETTEGYLKTYNFKYDGVSIGKVDIPKELVVTEGSVKKISVEKVDEGDDSTWIYTIVGTDPAETYTKADTEDEESDYYKYPLTEGTFIVLSIQNQSYPIFIDSKSLVSDTLGTITEDITANVEVGGFEIGDKALTGSDITAFAKQLLNKYYAPEIKLSSTPVNTIVEIGESVDIELSALVTKKTMDITEVSFYKGADLLETVAGDVSAGGTFTHTVADPITTGTIFKAIATDGKKTVESKVEYKFVHPFYTGVVADKSTLDITTLTKRIEDKGKKAITYVGDNEYVVFAYDASYGNLTSILDPSSFENLASFDKSVVDVGGTSYNVYTGKTTLTSAGFKYTFIF